MAVFNPTSAPGRDDMPNFFRYSEPVSQPQYEADKSAGLELSSVAGAISDVGSVAEKIAHEVIGEDVRNTVEPIRSQFTSQLQQARDNILGGSAPGSVQNPTQVSAPSTASTPAPIKAGLDKVDSIQSALINGKINDTYYHQRLDDAVTNLRSRYPGFVDYIDQKVASITGVNPANAVVGDLMQDINRALVNKKTATDKAIDDAMKSGYPGADQQINNLRQQGESYIPTFQGWYAKQTIFDSQIKRQDAIRKNAQGAKEDIANTRREDWVNEVGANLTTALDRVTTIPGIDTPKGIQSVLEDAAANPGKYKQEQLQALSAQLRVMQNSFVQQMRARARQTDKDNMGRTYSYNSDIGTEKVEQDLQNGAKMFGDMADLIDKGGPSGPGLAFYQAHHAQAILNRSKDSLLSGDQGDMIAKLSNFQELMGPNWTGLIVKDALRNRIDDKLNTVLDDHKMDARMQPDFDKTGKPITMKQHMEEADQWQKDNKITAQMKSRYYGKLVNIVDDIKNKDAPDSDKINVVKYLFSPEGQGILSHIKNDYVDPNTGKPVAGRDSVFTRLTSDDVVSEISRLAKSDPSIGQMYKNYMEREAGSQLFLKDFLNLNHYTGSDNLVFKYNDGTKGGVPYISLEPTKGAMESPVGKDSRTFTQRPPQDSYIFQVQKTVDRVNNALAGMSRVEKGLGGDVNGYILNFMQRSQVDFGTKWEGIPAQIMDAIAAARKERRIEDTFAPFDKGKK